MIRVEGLAFGYGAEPVLGGIDLEVREGEILGVIGPNGCGKSTLLRLLRGLLRPNAGSVRWGGREAHRISRREIARRVAVVAQAAPAPFAYRVREVVAMGGYARGAAVAVDRVLALTDILHLADRPVTALSGGELQRVFTARALAQSTPALFLDEATSHLDLDHRWEIADLVVRRNREQGTTVVQVSHDLDLAAETSHRLLVLSERGTVVALGPPARVLIPSILRQVFRVEVRIEANPYTGAPRVLPVRRPRRWRGPAPRVHVICGGGSGGELLRKLHTAGCRVTVGPLNRGDSDEALARALGVEVVGEEPFCPISPRALAEADALCRQAQALVVAPTAWGPGNVGCLELVRASMAAAARVYLIDPRAERDFTGGRAWSDLQALRDRGARTVADVQEVLEDLSSDTLRGPVP
ncbi:MAG: ABC transporter ATP-binding protein [Deferrisomatales bacterium]|nr:ABC transporter ATP-binding protein [Deferrisomatales bacterium]